MSRIRLTRDGFYVGHAGMSTWGAAVIMVASIGLAFYKPLALAFLGLIPAALLHSWLQYKEGLRRCPTCGGTGTVWADDEASKRGQNGVSGG